jgi:hypothetical protein
VGILGLGLHLHGVMVGQADTTNFIATSSRASGYNTANSITSLLATMHVITFKLTPA